MNNGYNFNNYYDTFDVEIFTDASCSSSGDFTSPGYIIRSNKYNLNIQKSYYFEGTVSLGEISAINLAIINISNLISFGKLPRGLKYVLFSDSEYCTNSLTKWYYGWFKRIDDGIMYNSKGLKVSHQHIMNNIIENILYNQIDITIIHTYGHYETRGIPKCKKKLKKNGFKCDSELTRHICESNSAVDNHTRDYLYNPMSQSYYLMGFKPFFNTLHEYTKLLNNYKTK